MELEEIEVELDDDTLIVNLTLGFDKFGTTEHIPDQPINTISPVVSEVGVGVRDGSVTSENALYQRKKKANDFQSLE